MSTEALRTLEIRPARTEDLRALVALEEAVFDYDRLSRRNFQWMQRRANAALLVATPPTPEGETAVTEPEIAGYALVLFHRGTSLARLYSIAVSDSARGQRLGARLLEAAEAEAVARGAVYLRLEVRADNATAIQLYVSRGYVPFERVVGYYGQHGDALRFEKRIRFPSLESHVRAIPYYEQITDFTCGSASLMMAMAALDSDYTPSRQEELQIWREATTIFMTSGHGGCSPHGLAVAAATRGFEVSVYSNSDSVPFLEGVRDEAKKEVMRLVHEDFLAKLDASHAQVVQSVLSFEELRARMDEGVVPVVLISEYRLTHKKAPHWVVLTGYDERFVYMHDPGVDEDEHRSATDYIHVPVTHADFERMSRFGRSRLRSVVMLSAPRSRSGDRRRKSRRRTPTP
ncbi:MAG: GNAT family N-acetyltransferase/peptidase C39 family protein [Sandaracinaceae bacterium]|jgi:ribosomal protein S18 acetylase RimI-like enzyme|nr:GNAT family N-acetyltransferase/peptidase C39 family protein [Sandaracinaceae bacterium]MBP7682046.1 GNAT family N-acetyltransferase/peptidase C39 family protein [Deltaproteobacteria bacterium]MBK7156933.1 GNAT family N-acetyltransferase/peptidase C39 family protein [Sandaracinaceae bacterium]MBK7776049.1 GNAT family N-acetyltransferase/peptidase C39 family protein [Sandaracinaceae bacterium]MBK8407876.1 GNAT family N-acetyltransferase/peptidase C39 family protein [Sandaracinaceae bacterium]